MKTNSISAGLAAHARTIATTRQLIFRRAWLWTGFLAFATIAFEPQPAQAAVTEAWVQRYGSETGSEDYAYKVVTDAAGNVIVAGSTGSWDYRTGVIIKYSGAGVPLWTNRNDNVTHLFDPGRGGVAVDGSGNVFVTGSSVGSGGDDDYSTIAYSGAGVPLWTNRHNGTGNGLDVANAVAVDGSGNVFVTGYSYDGYSSYDYETIAYSGAGVPLWTNRYSGGYATALAVDASGNVFVTGSSATIAYSGAGVPLWTNGSSGTAIALDGSGNVFVTGGGFTIAYSGAGVPLWTNYDPANAVAVDGSGNVFVTGSSVGSGGNYDYTTIAYSGAGVPLWTNRYNGTANGDDYAYAMAVDGSGNVFVTGSSYNSGGTDDYATIAYSGAGVPLWTNYAPANAVAVDGSGNVFVTGSSTGSGGDSDYATIAYSGAGVALWTNRYGGRVDVSDSANAVAVDGSGNIFVTGSSATIAYSGAGVPLWTNGGWGTAIALDASGNVFVTGNSATIAYSGAGVPLWTNGGWGTAIAVDGSGNVFVTGSSFVSGGNVDYATIAYSGAGVPLWTKRYNGPANGYDAATAVAVDASGNVFVTGSSYGIPGYVDYATIAYSGAGVALWTNRYNGTGNSFDGATAMAVDASGNVFVTGSSVGLGGGYDYATIAYSGAGVPLWTKRYNFGIGPTNASDTALAVAVDGSGNVFVTGSSTGSGGNYDYATIAYSGAGVPLWTKRYNGPANASDTALAVAVDGSGNVFVTGTSGSDYATIVYSGAGVPLWTNRYDADWPHTKSSLAIGSDGAVYVTGTSDDDFVTVKYIWRTEIAIQLLSTIPPKVNLTLSGAPNSSWAIERAMELTGPWANLSALLIGTNGSAQLQDTNSPYPAGFYRARQQ